MDARAFRRIQRCGWDVAVDAYDRGWVPLIGRLTRAAVARAALAPGERVLDVATGSGGGALAAAEAVGPTGAVLGVDISEAMVVRARARVAAGTARFERRDMDDTGAATASFDAVVSAFGLMYAPD